MENPHLSWRQVGAKAGLPTLEKETVQMFRRFGAPPYLQKCYRYCGTDVGYGVQMYCKWWGKRYPMRVR